MWRSRLRDSGDNRFRITVYDSSGAPVAEACSEITIFRTHASAAGIPATHTLSVKVIEAASGQERNELEPLVTKGTLLPAHGSKSFRAAKNLRGAQSGQIDIEFFQQAEGVPEPELNLFVGSFHLEARTDLEEGDFLRKGDEIIIRWEMDDNGLLKMRWKSPRWVVFSTRATSIHLPQATKTLKARTVRPWQWRSWLMPSVILKMFKTTLGNKVDADVGSLQRRVERQKKTLSQSVDADTRRSVAEEARAIRQDVSRLKHSPENWTDVLLRDLAATEEAFEQDVRELADTTSAELFDRLVVTARQAIRNGDMSSAERALKEMDEILYRELGKNPAYLVYLFKTLSAERYLSVNKALHDKLMSEGDQALAANDIDGLRHVLARMSENRFSVGGDDKVITAMASLMRG